MRRRRADAHPEGEDIPRGIFKREVNDGADLGKLFRRR